MRARHLWFGVCLVSCLAVACGDDEHGSPGNKAGSAGMAAAAGNGNDAGSSSGGKGNAGEPGMAGADTGMAGAPEGGTGGVGPNPLGFAEFVHVLIEEQTTDDATPESVNDRQFDDPTDDHGHYLVPDDAFDDLF